MKSTPLFSTDKKILLPRSSLRSKKSHTVNWYHVILVSCAKKILRSKLRWFLKLNASFIICFIASDEDDCLKKRAKICNFRWLNWWWATFRKWAIIMAFKSIAVLLHVSSTLKSAPPHTWSSIMTPFIPHNIKRVRPNNIARMNKEHVKWRSTIAATI